GPDDAYIAIDKWHQLLLEIEDESRKLRDLQELFELAVTTYDELKYCRSEIRAFKEIWDLASHVTSLFKDWMKTPFKKANVDYYVQETKSLRDSLKTVNTKLKSTEA